MRAGLVSDERREYQRLFLTKPISGFFGDHPVHVVDVSARGAQVVGQILLENPIPLGTRLPLRFAFRNDELCLEAVVVRLVVDRCGVHFVGDCVRLRELMHESALELLRAREANAAGDRDHNVIGEESLTAASRAAWLSRAYVIYEFREGKWQMRPALVPDQPPDGFTISAAETPDQIDLLCRTFESGDDEARKMIRMVAELSVKR